MITVTSEQCGECNKRASRSDGKWSVHDQPKESAQV